MKVWLAALWLALIPPIASLAASEQSPWLFNVAVCVGSAFVPAIWIWRSKDRISWRRTLSGLMIVPVAILCLSRVQHALFVWAAQYANFALTTVLFRLWPLVFVGSILYLTGTRLNWRAMSMMLGSAALAAVVLLSQQGGTNQSGDEYTLLGLFLGGALALLAATLSGLGPAASLAIAWRQPKATDKVKSVAVSWVIVSCAVMVFPSYAVSLAASEQFVLAILLAGFVVGILNGAAYLLIISGNFEAKRPSQNAALIVSPIAALAILHIMGTELSNLMIAIPAALGAIILAGLTSTAPQITGQKRPA